MASTEMMIFKAILNQLERTDYFRNRQIVEATGLERQNVYYYLTKWVKQGYVTKINAKYYLADKEALIDEIFETGLEKQPLGHAKEVELLDLGDFHLLVDTYVAIKSLGLKSEKVLAIKHRLENMIDEAIDQLTKERSYMHRKTMSPKRAVKFLDSDDKKTWKRLGMDEETLIRAATEATLL